MPDLESRKEARGEEPAANWQREESCRIVHVIAGLAISVPQDPFPHVSALSALTLLLAKEVGQWQSTNFLQLP